MRPPSARAAALAALMLGAILAGAAPFQPNWPDEARRKKSSGDLDGAIEIYRIFLQTDPPAEARMEILIELGQAYQLKGDPRRAIEAYRAVVEADPDGTAQGRRFQLEAGQSRARAQLAVAGVLLEEREYARALDAYRLAESKYRLQSWCGNGRVQFGYMYAFQQALCLDWLGRKREAAALYFKAQGHGAGSFYLNPLAGRRLLHMYEAAGQIEDLRGILDAYDSKALADARRSYPESDWTEEKILQYSSSGQIREYLAMLDMEASGDWSGLIAHLRLRGTLMGPYEEHGRRLNGQALEAARILGRNPEEAVPLLVKRLGEEPRKDLMWVYYALGLCGTREAADTLAATASKEQNIWWTHAGVYALGLAGEEGERALDEILPAAEGNLKFSIEQHRAGMLGTQEPDPDFPPLPTRGVLPRTLADLEAARADLTVAGEEVSAPKNRK